MAVYEVEMRVVEIHTYRVEAESAEQAVDLAWDDPSPTFIEHVCMELDDVTEVSPVQQAQELLGEIKEDVKELRTELSDAEYYQLRGENADWLSGKANIPFKK